MKARVLITGGAGFLGSHLADRLLGAGYRVRLLDNLDPQVHPRGAPAYLDPEAELQVGSVLDPEALDRALCGVECVAHFAAVVGVGQSHYQIARYHAVNVQGTAELLQAMLRRQQQRGSGVGGLLVAGSMSMYGEGCYWCAGCQEAALAAPRTLEQLRRQEWEPPCGKCGGGLEPRPTGESKPAQMGSVYALNKFVQEELCHLFGRTYGVPTVVLRFFNAYGPRQALSNPYTGVSAVFAAELLAGRAPRVFEDGRQLRDLVSVHDVAAACQRALETPGAAGATLNIASGRPVSVVALAENLARALGVDIAPAVSGRYRVGDARHCYADIAAARERLGFAPQVAMGTGLGELAEWLGRQPGAAAAGAAGALRIGAQAGATAELARFGLTG